MLALGFGLVAVISVVWVAGTLFFGLTSESQNTKEEDDDDKAFSFVDE